jgi:4-aminobutyrate aminotransferase-like enzyme
VNGNTILDLNAAASG